MAWRLFQRQDTTPTGNEDGTDVFLRLIADPFQSQIQTQSFYAALIWAFAVGTVLFLLFCLLRPRITHVYAPRAKHADAKHAPPSLGPGFFSWWKSLKAVREQDLVEKIGLDATIFLRFMKMSRNIFLLCSIVGCAVIIPVTLSGNHYTANGGGNYSDVYVFIKITPQFIYGSKFWAYVVLAYVFNIIILFFLWRNFQVITRLRRTYFESVEYQNSLHSRTLLVTHIPDSLRGEEGLVQLVQEGKALESIPKTSIGRNVKELPELIEQHEEAVYGLEKVLAKYLKDPTKMPANRPKCKPSKDDKTHSHDTKVDAIDYYTGRISELERQIVQTRESVDRRNPLHYGFASYTHIEDAHAVAYAVRKTGPHGTTIKLAPRPHDLIWKNLPMTRKARRTQSIWNGFWMVALTVLYIPPNVLTAVFLANLHNLGQVWAAFERELNRNPTGWAIAQGILAPGIQILFYLFLPTIFRRLLIRAGDTTKTSRERHVMSKLFAFFLFNKLFVFSIFASAWAFVATVVNAQDQNVWDAIKDGHLVSKVTIGLCNISPYWITFQLQSYLGAAIDIVQAWPLIYNFFQRRFTSPTPRQLVQLTAPQPFQYADYYANYLFVAAVGLAIGTLQPLVLPVTALYLTIEAWFKKYMLQYIFITKVESGGAFWPTVFNRFIFNVLLMDAVIALVVGSQGNANPMLFVMIPLLPILIGFKWFCNHQFNNDFYYYSTRSFGEHETGDKKADKLRRAGDKVSVRYGHPALYKKLITPMVHAKSEHLLKQLYRGRLDGEFGNFGYGDVYMSQMNHAQPGKTSESAPFEVVNESDLDFENFKRRSEFREQFGGDGELYGRAEDQISRPGTPSSMLSFGASTLIGKGGERSRSESPAQSVRKSSIPLAADETVYARGYANISHPEIDYQPSRSSSPAYSQHMGSRPGTARLDAVDIPSAGLDRRGISNAGLEAYHDDTSYFPASRKASTESLGAMLRHAQAMGRSASPGAATTLNASQAYQQPGVKRKAVGSNANSSIGSPSSATFAHSVHQAVRGSAPQSQPHSPTFYQPQPQQPPQSFHPQSRTHSPQASVHSRTVTPTHASRPQSRHGPAQQATRHQYRYSGGPGNSLMDGFEEYDENNQQTSYDAYRARRY